MQLRGTSILALIACTVLATIVLASDAFAYRVYTRGDWVTGLSLGFGRGQFTDSIGVTNQVREGVSPQVRFARMLGRHWAVGLEYEGWLIERGNLENRFRRSLQQFSLAATWFPGNPENAWSGLWLRAGAGIGWAGTAEVGLVPDDDTEELNKRRVDESGLGLLAGIGYEFWVFRGVTVGVGVSVNYLSIGETFVDDAFYVPVTFNLGWYF